MSKRLKTGGSPRKERISDRDGILPLITGRPPQKGNYKPPFPAQLDDKSRDVCGRIYVDR